MKNNILPFWKPNEEYGEFSNWYDSPMIIDEVTYQNTEQYMMSEKAKLFGDQRVYKEIMESNSPREYKKLGRKVKNFDDKLWDEKKYDIVLKGNIAKFSQNKKLRDLLLSTGNAILVEASPYDDIWGIKLDKYDERTYNKETWLGKNLLGYVLMDVREILKNEK